MISFYSLLQIISNNMKSSSKVVTSVKDFKLLLTPRSIIFLKKNPHTFRIYIEKDLQVIGTVQQFVPPLAANKKYTFSEYNPPIQFRAVSQKKNIYKVALYQLDPSGLQQFVENSELKFSKLLDDYYHEFLEIEQQLNSELKAREAAPIHDIWKNLINNFTKKIFATSVRFEKFDAILDFAIEPLHKYDEILREAEALQEKRKQKRSKRLEDVFHKTKTIPDTIVHEPGSATLKRGHTENQLEIIKPFSFEKKREEANKHQINEELKNFNITIHQKNKNGQQEVAENKNLHEVLVESSDKIQQSKNANIYIRDEKQVNQSKQLHQKSQTQREYPTISVENQKYLLMAERKTQIKKITPIKSEATTKNDETGASSSKTLKENVLLSFALLACMVIGYFLMHPLPKA